jgi:hypothetical protein
MTGSQEITVIANTDEQDTQISANIGTKDVELKSNTGIDDLISQFLMGNPDYDAIDFDSNDYYT